MTSWRSYILGLLCGLLAAALILLGNGRLASRAIPLQTAADPPGVRVSVQGEVVSPGVYRLPPGSIVQDAVAAAGGLLAAADPGRINQAAVLLDGQEIRIPMRVTPSPIPSPGETGPSPASGGKINLNTATLADLDSLPGIGPTLAQRIIDYRESHGPFQSVDELLSVKGIGNSLLMKIRDLAEAP